MDAAISARNLAAGQYGVLSRAQALRLGMTSSQVRTAVHRGRWVPRHRGVYEVLGRPDPADERRHLLSAVMAAQLALGPEAFASGTTAARLWGMQGLPRWDGDLTMTVPGAGRWSSLPDVEVRGWATAPREVTRRGAGIRLTVPGRTLRDVLLTVDRDTAVCLLDSALSRRLLPEELLPTLAAANAGRPGAARSRSWWEVADSRAQSPLETRVRLVCHDAGLPPDDLQHRFWDTRGTLIAVGDLWWAELRVLGECDGRGPHEAPEALHRDRRRQNALMRAVPGLRILRFTWRDLHTPDYIVAAVRGAAAHAEHR